MPQHRTPLSENTWKDWLATVFWYAFWTAVAVVLAAGAAGLIVFIGATVGWLST